MFNVSYVTALVRLRQANIITASAMDKLRAFPPVRTAAAFGYPSERSPSRHSVLTCYPLRFRRLLRDALAQGKVGRSSTEQTLQLTYEQVDELTDTAPVISSADMRQEWDEYAALGAVPA